MRPGGKAETFQSNHLHNLHITYLAVFTAYFQHSAVVSGNWALYEQGLFSADGTHLSCFDHFLWRGHTILSGQSGYYITEKTMDLFDFS